MQTITLNDGVQIPLVGFGTFHIPADGSTYQAVREALKLGYRHIDTAACYFNEEEVGRAIRESGIPRSQIFLTSKLWISDFGFDGAKRGIERSLRKLGTYVDLYLLHHPYGDLLGAWTRMEEYQQRGDLRSIGVSNMTPTLWERWIPQFDKLPSVNQIKLHPLYQQRDMRQIQDQTGVRLEAWGPLGQGDRSVIANPVIAKIGRTHGTDVGQVIVRWGIQQGIVMLPRSTKPAHIASNLDVWDFELTDEEMARIDALDEGVGKPHRHDDPELEAYLREKYVITD